MNLEVAYRIAQVIVLVVTWLMMSLALRSRLQKRDPGGQEQFQAFYWLVTAMTIAVILGASLGIEINPGSILVTAAAAYCAYTLVPSHRRPKRRRDAQP